MITHFWLLCGIWAGLFGGIYNWFSLNNQRNAELFTRQRALTCSRNYAVAILTPCLALWLLQLSANIKSPNILADWPSLQRNIASVIIIICWAALLVWVNFWGGAKTLSDMMRATRPNNPEIFTSETAMRILSILVVISGSIGLWASVNAT